MVGGGVGVGEELLEVGGEIINIPEEGELIRLT